jgi:hypothetical protein
LLIKFLAISIKLAVVGFLKVSEPLTVGVGLALLAAKILRIYDVTKNLETLLTLPFLKTL